MVPADYNELMFIYEWGISWQQYDDTPSLVIGRLKEMISAKSEGERRKTKEIDRKEKLNQMKLNNQK